MINGIDPSCLKNYYSFVSLGCETDYIKQMMTVADLSKKSINITCTEGFVTANLIT
jgi:hypothetical protein